MIIVINAFSAKVGGGVTYLNNLLALIPDDLNLEIHVFGGFDESAFPDTRLKFVKTSWSTDNPYIRLLWERFALRKYLKHVKASILFCPGGVVNTKVPRGCKVVTMFRNMLPFDVTSSTVDRTWRFKLKNYLLRRAMLRSMKEADLVIFISEYAKSVVQSHINVKASATIYHGINDLFRKGTSLDRPALPFDEEYILYVSRFEPYKRHLELVKAYSQLPDHLKEQYKLLIVGGGFGKSESMVREYIASNLLSQSVFLLPSVSYNDVVPLYHNAFVFAFVSACENCPNILLEALASELPIVCSDVQPMPEFAGGAVLYTSPDCVTNISQCLYQVLTDDSIRSGLSASARDCSAQYDWKVTASNTWHLLNRIGNRSN